MLLAFREARRCQHDFLGTEHVLFGLLCDSTGPAAALLRALGAPPEAILGQVQELMLDDETSAALERFPLSPAVRRAFEHAGREAQELGQNLIGPEHLLLGLLHEPEAEAARILGTFKLNLAAARQSLALLPPADMPEHQLQPGARAAAANTHAESEPTVEALQTLVAPLRAPDEPSDDKLSTSLAADRRTRGAGEMARYADAVESQLRLTQLALGGVLGFVLGHLLRGLEGAILLGLGGLAVAALRSSLLGLCVGLISGLLLPPLAGAHEFDDPLHASRLLLGLLGGLLGSFLGDFWRRPLARLSNEPPAVEDPD